jgi:AraC-like DNA-binding protein
VDARSHGSALRRAPPGRLAAPPARRSRLVHPRGAPLPLRAQHRLPRRRRRPALRARPRPRTSVVARGRRPGVDGARLRTRGGNQRQAAAWCDPGGRRRRRRAGVGARGRRGQWRLPAVERAAASAVHRAAALERGAIRRPRPAVAVGVDGGAAARRDAAARTRQRRPGLEPDGRDLHLPAAGDRRPRRCCGARLVGGVARSRGAQRAGVAARRRRLRLDLGRTGAARRRLAFGAGGALPGGGRRYAAEPPAHAAHAGGDAAPGRDRRTARRGGHRVGYQDAFGFSKVFKKVVGASPRDFRRREAEDRSSPWRFRPLALGR